MPTCTPSSAPRGSGANPTSAKRSASRSCKPRCRRWPKRWMPRWTPTTRTRPMRSEEHTSELQSQSNLVCRLLLEKKKIKPQTRFVVGNTDISHVTADYLDEIAVAPYEGMMILHTKEDETSSSLTNN